MLASGNGLLSRTEPTGVLEALRMYASPTCRLEVEMNLNNESLLPERIKFLGNRAEQFMVQRLDERLLKWSGENKKMQMRHLRCCYEHVKAEGKRIRTCRAFSLKPSSI